MNMCHMEFTESTCCVDPLIPMSDQDWISPYNINTESSRLVGRIKMKTQSGDYKLIQYQILPIEIISALRQTVGRITNEILGVKGLIKIRIVSFWFCDPVILCKNLK